jgi:hypothetical protein
MLHLIRPLFVRLVLAFGKFIAEIIQLEATPQTHVRRERLARAPSGEVQAVSAFAGLCVSSP